MADVPMNPESMPQGAPQGKGGVPQLITKVGEGLAQVAKLFQEAGAPPELMDKMGMIVQEYGNVVDQLSGGKPQGQEAAQPGVASPEAAGNARPV